MMVFLNGNSNLDPFGAMNINQMEMQGSTKDMNIVVQWGSLASKTTKRLYIEKDNDPSKVTSPVVYEVPDLDMGNKQTLKNFIAWTAKNYPAKKYFIAVWNHGGGWHFTNSAASNDVFHPTDISWDDKSGNKITTEELGEVMHDAAKVFGHKVDVYASDACLMSMIEVAHEMSGAVSVFAGSQENEPGEGWPYHRLLKKWQAKPKASALDVGRFLTESYGEEYNATETRATFSAIDMAKLPNLVKAMRMLGPKLTTTADRNLLRREVQKAVRFNEPSYVDLGDALQRIRNMTGDSSTLKAIAQAESALKAAVYINRTNAGAHGLSLWWPTDVTDWSLFDERYSGLKFSRDSHWNLVLKELFR